MFASVQQGFSQLANPAGFCSLNFEKLLGRLLASPVTSSGLAQGLWEGGLLILI